jgi:xylulose-5-phosphate/fructose-6-phosphate phosphoketolase
MPGEVVNQPNPPALPSQLPDTLLGLEVKPERQPLPKGVTQSLRDFQNAACYIAAGESGPRNTSSDDCLAGTPRPAPHGSAGACASKDNANCRLRQAMIFLRDNVLLEKDLSFDDIKPRLLGETPRPAIQGI